VVLCKHGGIFHRGVGSFAEVGKKQYVFECNFGGTFKNVHLTSPLFSLLRDLALQYKLRL